MVRIVAEEAASPEFFLGSVLDVSLLLFPEVKVDGYLATWLVGCAGLLPMVDPFHRCSPPDSWIPLLQMGKRKGLRCNFYTSAKGMWLPHLPRLGGLMALWVAMLAVFSVRYSIPFYT